MTESIRADDQGATDAPRAKIRRLEHEEMMELLGRNHVARLAYCYRNRVGIAPVHYVHAGNWLYGRTSAGEKLEAVRTNWWVAVAVDEIAGMFDWRSVVVRGGFYLLTPDGPPESREQWEEALREVRRLVPETFTDRDPTPGRTVLFGVAIQEISGLESSI
ncbi:MAG TPA: pyridoxamine 5'-phosphate oxidase family protein [Longimicrobiales bacterium]|nr:pyridoxamine 5'-phosphate oxidase family protein [Longimicrobiales bacterium]